MVLAVFTATACGVRSAPPIQIGVDAPVALEDQAVHIRVTGVGPDRSVTVRAEATDYRGTLWHAEATYQADREGAVDLDRAKALSGTYTGVDGMGLFWSMVPATGDPESASFFPNFPGMQPAFQVHLSVSVPGRLKARAEVTREWCPNGVSHRALTLTSDGVIGDLYLPPAGSGPHPAVLTFGGSEGGVSGGEYNAALFAAHGYPALALGYFGLPGLPATLTDVPMEYFAHAARILAGQPGVDAGHVIAMGYSRGSEAALLLAQDFPDVIHGAIVYAPSAVVNAAFPSGGAAWTMGGKGLRPGEAIPVDRIAGPVLAIAGTDDQLWSSAPWAEQIDLALTQARHAYPHHALLYEGAGHKVGTFPYLPSGTGATVAGHALVLGGSRASDETAARDGWPKVLTLVAGTM